MDAYALIGPIAVLGLIGGTFFMLVAPWMLPRYPRPYLTAWTILSAFLGAAVFIDRVEMQEVSPLAALGWSAAIAVLMAVVVAATWARIHMWDFLADRQRKREMDDANARYRPKDFGG